MNRSRQIKSLRPWAWLVGLVGSVFGAVIWSRRRRAHDSESADRRRPIPSRDADAVVGSASPESPKEPIRPQDDLNDGVSRPEETNRSEEARSEAMIRSEETMESRSHERAVGEAAPPPPEMVSRPNESGGMQLYSRLGDRLRKQDQKQRAAAEYLRALKEESTELLDYNWLGDRLFELELYEEAVQAYRRVIELEPLQEDPYLSKLGKALLKAGQTEAGLESLRAAVALAPRSPKHRIELAEALIAAEERDAGIQQLRKAAEIPTEKKFVDPHCIE